MTPECEFPWQRRGKCRDNLDVPKDRWCAACRKAEPSAPPAPHEFDLARTQHPANSALAKAERLLASAPPAPPVTICVQCGPHVNVTEDGACVNCGCDALPSPDVLEKIRRAFGSPLGQAWVSKVTQSTEPEVAVNGLDKWQRLAAEGHHALAHKYNDLASCEKCSAPPAPTCEAVAQALRESIVKHRAASYLSDKPLTWQEGYRRALDHIAASLPVPSSPPRGEESESSCDHGVAWDVHCCECHRGGFSPPDDCTCATADALSRAVKYAVAVLDEHRKVASDYHRPLIQAHIDALRQAPSLLADLTCELRTLPYRTDTGGVHVVNRGDILRLLEGK